MQAILFGSIEMQMLWWSVIFGLVQIALTASLATRDRGIAYNAGPRDETPPPVSRLTGRASRAFRNYLETFAFFAVGVLMVIGLHRSTPTSELGAQMYFWGRVIYLPVYMAGVPYLRTLVWAVATAGLVMVLLTVWPGI